MISKVTAIVSAYFAEDFIGQRIDNLLMQEPIPEIIIVCQNESAEFEIALEKQTDFAAHNVIKIIKTDDIPTIYAAWNMAIKQASRDYVTNANTDDMLELGALRRMAKVMDDSGTDVLFTGLYIAIEKNAPVIWRRNTQYQRGFVRDVYSELKRRCFVGPMPMWRKSLHDVFGYFDESFVVAGDYEFWLRAAQAGRRFWYEPETMGTYSQRMASLEHRNRDTCNYETRLIRERYKK